MTHFGFMDSTGKFESVFFSPDHRFFATITSRGVIRSNTVESTIWVFSTAAVRAFMRDDHLQAPKPRMIARIAAVPQTQYPSVYEPSIFALQWLPNSKGMLFLAEASKGQRRLYQADVLSGSVRALTPADCDVVQFAFTRGSIVYEATPLEKMSRPVGAFVNNDAVDLTGMPLDAILFPQSTKGNYSGIGTYSNLWILHDAESRRVTGNDPVHPFRIWNPYWPQVISVAPDGHLAVVLFQVDSIPQSWSTFEPSDPALRIHPEDPTTAASSNLRRPLEYTLVDTTTGSITPLIQAPDGWALGSLVPDGVVWSPNSKKALLMNTYLPLEGVDSVEQAQRHYPCVVAVVDVHSKKADCLAFSQGDSAFQDASLQEASFNHNDEIVLRLIHWSNRTVTDDRYRYEHGNWHTIASTPDSLQTLQQLSVDVQQDLNTPPALWVTDPDLHVTKKLWDPNPSLAKMDLGEASVFRWKDASGYQWVAGLVKPPDYIAGKRYPLVIEPYAFDKNTFISDGFWTTAFATRPLASAGMVVLQMGRNNEHEGYSQEISDQLHGYASAIAQLNAIGLIDPKRVGIIGFSRTSYHVESALTQNPSLFAAASINDGVDESYMQYLLNGVDSPNSHSEAEQLYDTAPFGKGLAAWIQEAPSFNLDRVQTPLLITAITSSSILEEWEMYASLRMQNKPVGLMYIPDGQHILQKPLDRLASQQGNVDWFRFWLQGYEDPDPAKRAQYKRWENLRELQQDHGAKAASATN